MGSLKDGEWVNVIGYIKDEPDSAKTGYGGQHDKDQDVVYVQAIQVWDAGSVNLGRYESITRERLKVERAFAKSMAVSDPNVRLAHLAEHESTSAEITTTEE